LDGLDDIFNEYKKKLEASRLRFQKSNLKRRIMIKEFQANLRKKISGLKGTLEELLDEKMGIDNPEEKEFYEKLKETFNAFDVDGSSQLQLPEYIQAWDFLNQPGGEDAARKAFNMVDIDGNKVVTVEEFVFSIMGDAAMKYGPLAEMDDINVLLNKAVRSFTHLKETLVAAKEDTDNRASRNALLRDRMEGMKQNMSSDMVEFMNKMKSGVGIDPSASLQSEEEVKAHLKKAFEKYDANSGGTIDYREFKKAWKHLGLAGNDDELQSAFNSVDTDGSGVVDVNEFTTAIMNNRLEELSLNTVLGDLGMTGDQITKYVNAMKNRYSVYAKTIARRRQKAKAMSERLDKLTEDMVTKLEESTGKKVRKSDPQKAEFYKKLYDTFNAFDGDGSGEMKYDEYQEAWRFLGIPGRPEDIHKAFKSVDADGSGVVDWNEFVFSIMGEAAVDFGPLANMEALTTLLEHVTDMLSGMSSSMEDINMTAEERRKRNARLMGRLKKMKRDSNSQINGIFSTMLKMSGRDPSAVLSEEQINKYLTQAFGKFEKSGDGKIDFAEFGQAWAELGLHADESELKDIFAKIDVDSSGYVDLGEFMGCVKDNRVEELGMKIMLEHVGAELEHIESLMGSYGDRYESFEKATKRRRMMQKQYQDNIAKQTQVVIKTLTKIVGESLDERDPERVKYYNTTKDTFNAFDKDASGKLDRSEFVSAYKFMDQPGSDSEIGSIFDGIDVDQSGFLESTEFIFSIMGEEALKYGPLADLELMNKLLNRCALTLTSMSDALKESQDNQSLRKTENAKLMAKLKASKSQLNTEVNDMMAKMMSVTGQDDFFDMEEIDMHLREAFDRFDENKNRSLDKWEFTQAWSWLGLKGSRDEIEDAFDMVDKDSSGVIDQDEFMSAIKSERLAELNLRTVMKKMGVHMDTVEERYSRFKSSSARRRLLKKEMDEQMEVRLGNVIDKLMLISGRKEVGDESRAKLTAQYQGLKDTFNAFDADGSAELGYPEYVEAWKFLKQPDDANLIKSSFDGVDMDTSGKIEWAEFVFSIMKEDAGKVGPLADLEILLHLLDDVEGVISAGAASLNEVKASVEERAKRNAGLKDKLKNMRGDMNGELNKMMQMMGVVGEGDNFFDENTIKSALTKAFTKFDTDNSGWLGFTEFARAWGELGLGNAEDQIMRAYYSVDKDRSGSITLVEFIDAIQGEKADELNMNVIFKQMGDQIGIKFSDFANSKNSFKSFQATAARRRMLKKEMEEKLEQNMIEVLNKLCSMLQETLPDPEGRKLYETMRQTFNAFDNDGSGALNFSEFKEAWRFLQRPGGDEQIKRAFDNQDVDGSLHVDFTEFAFAIMGENAINYGSLADMELLNKLLNRMTGDMVGLLASVDGAKKSVAEQAESNEALRSRLQSLKNENDEEMQRLIGKINGLAGLDAVSMMTDADMDKILAEVFQKFDRDGSGTMELPEFKRAWQQELKLSGTDKEIKQAFHDVDVDNSGVIEADEFKNAVKGQRLAELNMKTLVSNLDGSLDSLGEYMTKFQDRYQKAMATAKRRRQARGDMMKRLAERSMELLEKFEEVNEEEEAGKDQEGAKMYKTLSETFDAFDKDGSGELAYPEYNASWKFLSQPGGESDIRNAFNSVDLDNSGLVDRDEFILSIMGPDAVKFGPIADMERLDAMMDGLMQLISSHRGELSSYADKNQNHEAESARLRARLAHQKKSADEGMNDILKTMMALTGNDIDQFLSSKEVDKYLVEAFNKFDANGNGTLSNSEFMGAWREMNLGGSETEMREAFEAVDTDKSGVVEYPEFSKAIKESRLGELSIQVILGSIGVELGEVVGKMKQSKGSFENMKRTMRRRAQKAREMQEKVARMLNELMGQVVDATDDESSVKRDPKKQQMYNDLNDTFKAFDRDNNAQLTYAEYKEAWRFLSLPGDADAVKNAFDKVDVDRSGNVDLQEFLYSIMGEDAANYGYLADLENLQSLLETLTSGHGKEAMAELTQAQKNEAALRKQVQQLQAELERQRNAGGSTDFNDVIQRMMFKVGVSRIGPMTSEELTTEIDQVFATASSNGYIDRNTFKEVSNSKKMMELRLRKLVAEIQADYWMESKAPGLGLEDEDVAGRDLATTHTAEEALHLRSFLRTSALVIQFCRRIQMKFSHADIEGSIKAAKALSHLLIRSQEELHEEIGRVKNMSGGRASKNRYPRGRRSENRY
jgi:Ca2+-binding EF-hand superfamily protein